MSPDWISARLVDSLKPSPASWIVDEYIPANTVTLISSVSGSGKSVLGLHLALSLASKESWLGMACHKSAPAYWDQDNPDAWLTDNRVCAIERGLGLAQPPQMTIFRTHRRVVGNPALLDHLIVWLRSLNVNVIVVDTLASVNPAAERDPESVIQTIAEGFFPMVDAGITPIVLHHIGKDFVDQKGGQRRRRGIHAARGSSALVAAVGAAFNLDRDGETRRLECVKPRYGVAPTLQIDYDEDGAMGSDDWRITIACPPKRLSHENLDSLIKERGWQTVSSRQLVSLLSDRGITISQSTANRVLSESRKQ